MRVEQSDASKIQRDVFPSPHDENRTWDGWAEYISPLFRARLDRNAVFSDGSGMASWKIGDVVVASLDGPAQTLVRDERMIAQQELDHVLVLFLERGSLRLETCGRRSVLDRGQVVVLDLLQPIGIEADAIGATAVFIPRRMIPGRHGHLESLHGRIFDYAGTSVRRLFHSYVTSLCELEDGILPHQLKGMSQAAATFCAACFPAETGSHRVADAEITAAIRRHIHDELVNPALDVDGIAERFGVSRAALYRLFSADGGVVKYVRDRRLLRAIKLLARPGPSGRPRVSTVAYATGFSDEKAFSRAFKKRFGYLPRDARSPDGSRPETNDNVSGLFNWLNAAAA